MIAAVRMDPTAFNTTEPKVATFERLLITLNQSMMLGIVLLFYACDR